MNEERKGVENATVIAVLKTTDTTTYNSTTVLKYAVYFA